MKYKDYDFQMTPELIQKCLQGLEIELVVDDARLKIHPPQRGVFFTHDEIKRLKLSSSFAEITMNDILKEKFGR